MKYYSKTYLFLVLFFISSVSFAGNKRIMEQESKKLIELNKKVVKKVLAKKNIASYNNKTVYIKAKIQPKKGDNFEVNIIDLSTTKIVGKLNDDEAIIEADVKNGKANISSITNVKNLVIPKILKGEKFFDSTEKNINKIGDTGVPK